jgi:hypothetical protein
MLHLYIKLLYYTVTVPVYRGMYINLLRATIMSEMERESTHDLSNHFKVRSLANDNINMDNLRLFFWDKNFFYC